MKHPFLAVLVIIFCFLSISVFLYSIQFKRLTSSKVILETFDKADVYNNLPKMVDEAFKNPEGNPQEAIIFKAVSIAIEPKYFRNQLETNLPLVLAYLNSKTDTLKMNVDLKPFKSNFSTVVPSRLTSVVAQTIQDLPKCDETQNIKDTQIPECQEGDSAAINAKAQSIADSFNYKDFLSGIPDTFQFSSSNSQAFQSARTSFRILNITLIVSAVLSFILLLVLFLMGRPKLAVSFRWTGWAMAIPSAIHGGIMLLGKASIGPILSACLSKTNDSLGDVLAPVVSVFATKFFLITVFYSGIIFLGGVVLIIFSYILSSRNLKGQNVQPVQNAQQLPR